MARKKNNLLADCGWEVESLRALGWKCPSGHRCIKRKYPKQTDTFCSPKFNAHFGARLKKFPSPSVCRGGIKILEKVAGSSRIPGGGGPTSQEPFPIPDPPSPPIDKCMIFPAALWWGFKNRQKGGKIGSDLENLGEKNAFCMICGFF